MLQKWEKMRLSNKIHSILDTGNSLRKKVLIGSLWLYALQALSGALLISQTIILARLLAPEHFGIIGVFFIVSGALESFTNTGFGKALIQRENIDINFLNTAWTVSITRGAILSVVIFLISPIIGEFFNAPKAIPVIRVLALCLLFRGFNNIGIIYFSKKLEFHKQFAWKICGFLANFLISIPLAFILRNEWAIVWGLLASDFITLLLSYVLHPYRPVPRFDFEAFKFLFEYGKWLFLSAIVVFFARQGDKVFVAKLLGEAGLGIYIVAWRFARMPELLTDPLPNALFPAYSKFQNNPTALKKKYTDTLSVIGFFSIPLVAGMIVLAKPFITIFLGDKWLPAALPMQILTLSVGLNIFNSTSGSLFNAVGQTIFAFKVNSARMIALCICIYPLIAYYGVTGASLCYLVLSFVSLIIWKYEIYKLFEFTLRDLNRLLFPAINTLLVVVVLLYFKFMVPITHVSIFLVAACIIILLYFFFGLLIDKLTRFNFLQDFIEIMHILKPSQKVKGDDVSTLNVGP